tara:strand:- start:260 stop:628 length:369 start_codon:yes stop_codon:yes gene_type:complete
MDLNKRKIEEMSINLRTDLYTPDRKKIKTLKDGIHIIFIRRLKSGRSVSEETKIPKRIEMNIRAKSVTATIHCFVNLFANKREFFNFLIAQERLVYYKPIEGHKNLFKCRFKNPSNLVLYRV